MKNIPTKSILDTNEKLISIKNMLFIKLEIPENEFEFYRSEKSDCIICKSKIKQQNIIISYESIENDTINPNLLDDFLSNYHAGKSFFLKTDSISNDYNGIDLNNHTTYCIT